MAQETQSLYRPQYELTFHRLIGQLRFPSIVVMVFFGSLDQVISRYLFLGVVRECRHLIWSFVISLRSFNWVQLVCPALSLLSFAP